MLEKRDFIEYSEFCEGTQIIINFHLCIHNFIGFFTEHAATLQVAAPMSLTILHSSNKRLAGEVAAI